MAVPQKARGCSCHIKATQRCWHITALLIVIIGPLLWAGKRDVVFNVPKSHGLASSGSRPRFAGKALSIRPAVGGASSEPAADISTSAASLNLAKNIVGSGILSLPSGVAAFSASTTALVPSTVLLALTALLSAYTFFLIGRVCNETEASTFGSSWERSVGRGAWVPQLTCILECLGGSIVYAMVIGDVLSSLEHQIGAHLPAILCSRSSLIVLVAAFVLFPLCCLRSFGALAKFSALGTLATTYVVLFVTKRYFDGSYGPLGAYHTGASLPILDSHWGGINVHILVLVSILSTAYLVHFNAPQMFDEIRAKKSSDPRKDANESQSRFGTVSFIGFGIAAAQYALIMIFGFLTFGRATQGNLLLNYSNADPWAAVARAAIGGSVLFGYPMQFAGLRSGLLEAFGKKPSLPKVQHRLFTAFLLSGVVCVACLFRDLGKFQAVEGALLASFLIYIAPPVMALGLGLGSKLRTRLWYWFMIVLGVGFCSVGCVVTMRPF